MGAPSQGIKRAALGNRSETMTRLSRFALLTLAAGLTAGSLGACTPTVTPRGNQLPPSVLEQIKPGSTDKATVTRILGSPSSVATFDTQTWYYISQRMEELAFFKPEVTEQEVVVITFDKDNVVSNVQRMRDKGRDDLQPVARTTPAPGKELSFVEQLLGNFGRFNTANPQGRPGQ
jgi:outer membrane protein assembly factor BamE (lipoprotein component of BamABCDE complex)